MNWRTRCTKYSPTCPLVFTSGMTYRTVLTTGRDENTSCPVGTEYTITSLFLTEVHHYACAVNIPRLSHGCDDGIPRELPGDTTLFSTVARDARGSRRKRPSIAIKFKRSILGRIEVALHRKGAVMLTPSDYDYPCIMC